MKKIIYISGAISKGDIVKNMRIAKKYAIKFWNMGAAVICPHMNTAFFDQEVTVTATYDDFIAGDLAIVSRVDAIFALPNWRRSDGAIQEIQHAESLSIPILYKITEVSKFIKNNSITAYETIMQRLVRQQLTEITKKFVLTPRLSNKKPKKPKKYDKYM